jgi:Protein of unknown function (DUF2726)
VFTPLRPYFRRGFLLSKAEQSFFEILRNVALDHIVFAKVKLADLVAADERHDYWQANFNRVCSKHVDFVVCDLLFRPVVAIELDDKSHRLPHRRKRDEEVAKLLEEVRLPLARFSVRSRYNQDDVRRALLAKLQDC